MSQIMAALHGKETDSIMADIAPDPQQAPPEEMEDSQEKLILIPWLVGFLRWIEELIVALSGYGIVFALGAGVVDLLTDGQLTTQAPWIDYAYAVAFAAAIAGQIIGLSSRSARAFSKKQHWRGVAYFVLVGALAYTEYQASVIFGFHKAFGIPVATSLAQLGIKQSDFIQLRAGVGVFLAVLSGYLRWQPQKRKSIAQLQREADYKRQREAIEAQNRAAGLANLGGFAANAAKAARAAIKGMTATTTDEGSDVVATDAPADPGEVMNGKKN